MLAAWLFVALHVQSAGGCPTGVDVERQLTPLLGDEVAARDLATLAPAAGGALSLSLADPSGQAIGARTLPPARNCDEQAKAVAVTLAVWEAELHPEIALALDRLEPAPPPAVSSVAAPPARPAPRGLEWTLGAAAVGDRQSGTWAPGARLELGLGPGGRWWRARLAVGGVARHQTSLSPGTVSWRRGFVQLGGEADIAAGRHWAVAFGAGGLVGVASLSGAGFPIDRSTRSLELGGEARARVEARLGAPGRLQVRPWVGAAVAMWARRQSLDVEGTASTAALPRLEPMVTLGADFVW